MSIIEHAKRMRSDVLSSVFCRLYSFFGGELSHKGHDLREKRTKAIEHEMCALNSATAFVCNVSHYNQNSARYYQKGG